METVTPHLQKALELFRAYARDVELAVFGSIQGDSPSLAENVPPKKQQIPFCTSVCEHWGDFPLGDPTLERMTKSVAFLPPVLKKSAVLHLLRNAYEETIVGSDQGIKQPIDLIQATLELLIAEFVKAALNSRVDDAEIATALQDRALVALAPTINSASSSSSGLFATTAMVARMLSKRNDVSSSNANPWYWTGLISKLKSLAALRWSETLSMLSGSRADEFVLNRLTPLASSGGAAGAYTLSLAAYDLRPKTLGASQLPMLLIQAYGNADDDTVREALLDTLQAVLERCELTQQTERITAKALELADSASKGSREVKDAALRLSAALIAKTQQDSFDVIQDKILNKRVLRSLQGTDARKIVRAIALGRILLENARTPVTKQRLAQTLCSEVFERPRSVIKVLLRPLLFSPEEDYALADLARLIFFTDLQTGINRLFPALLVEDESVNSLRRMLILVLSLKLILEDTVAVVLSSEAHDFLAGLLLNHVASMLDGLSTSSGPFEWSAWPDRSVRTSSFAEDNYFANATTASSANDFRARLFLRRHRRHDQNVLSILEERMRGPTELDAATELRIAILALGAECLAYGRRALLGKTRTALRLPPIALLSRSSHHPIVQSCGLNALRIVASMSFSDYLLVIKAARDYVVAHLGMAEELLSLLRMDASPLPNSLNDLVNRTRDIGMQVEGLTVCLFAVGIENVACELCLVAERRGLFSAHGKGARTLRHLSAKYTSAKDIDPVRVALECDAPVQQEIIRVLLQWSGAKKSLPEPLVRGLLSRGIGVLLALDAQRFSGLESTVFEASLTRAGAFVSVLDVVRSAGTSESSAINVLSRVLSWWRSSANSNTASLLASHTEQTVQRRSFSVLRRFTNVSATGSQVSSAPNAGTTQTSATEELLEEDEVMIRVVRCVLEGGKVLEVSLDANGSKSEVLRLVRDAINASVGPTGAAHIKQRKLSSRFAADLCAVVSLLTLAIDKHVFERKNERASSLSNVKLSDEFWARADRRRLFIFLRRVSGYSDAPLHIDSSAPGAPGAGVVVDEAINAIRNLLGLGPVSLGQVADTPDPELWVLLLREPRLCESYLAAHLISLLSSYFAVMFPKQAQNAIFKNGRSTIMRAVIGALRRQLGISACEGVAPRRTIPDKVSRALLMCSVLLWPTDDNSPLTDEEIVELTSMAVISNPGEAAGLFHEVSTVTRELKSLGSNARREKLSVVCARSAPELAPDVVDLLWERSRFELADPWVTQLENPGPFFSSAWSLGAPAQTWRSFTDEVACTEFLLKRLREDKGDRKAEDLLREVAWKAHWSVINNLLVPLVPMLPSVCDRALDLFRNLFAERVRTGSSSNNLSRLVTDALLNENLGRELARWLRLRAIEDEQLKMALENREVSERSRLVAALFVLDANLLREVLDEALRRLRQTAAGAIEVETLFGLYADVRSAQTFPARFFANEEALTLASYGPLSIKALSVLVASCETAQGLETVARLTLSFLSESWLSSEAVTHDSEVLLLDMLERGFIPLNGPDAPSDHVLEQVFWRGLERLVRQAFNKNPVSQMEEINGEITGTVTYKILAKLALRKPTWTGALDMFKSDDLTDIGEDSALLVFRVAKERSRDIWMTRALMSNSAQAGLAMVALREILSDPNFDVSPMVLSAAASLVSRASIALSRAEPDLPAIEDRYCGIISREQSALNASKAWQTIVSEASSTTDSADSSFRRRSTGLKGPPGSNRRLKRPQQHEVGSPISEISHNNMKQPSGEDQRMDPLLQPKKPRKPVLDVRDALRDDYARMRLLAHAADRGIPQHLVLAYEQASYVPELDKDELWQSFQRSRWWLFEDDPTLQ